MTTTEERTALEMPDDRAEENLAFWRRLVGLDEDFPSLARLTDAELTRSVVTDASQMAPVRSSIASNQLTQIVVKPGWGATTLFKYMFQDASANVMEHLLLPVKIDLEEVFLEGGITPKALTREIRRQIITLLLENPWENQLNKRFYFDCINFEGGSSRASSASLARYRTEALRFLRRDKPLSDVTLGRRFPWLRDPLSKQVHFLLSNFRIQTALYIHLPRDIKPQRLREFISSIKWIARDEGEIDYAAWREVYFCTSTLRFKIDRDFERGFMRVSYNRYTAAQVYLMLFHRYPPDPPPLVEQKPVNLTDVFSEAFVEQAWRDATSLADLTDRLRGLLLRRLDCPSDEVPFRLEPLPAEVAKPAVDAGEGFIARRRAREGSRA